MTGSSDDVRGILERILSSYGVKTRQAYADLTNMPIGTINNWLKRDSIPGDYLIQCALDTGADLKWLRDGKLTNVSLGDIQGYPLKGRFLLEKMQSCGGKIVLRRILDAYGFTLQKELGDHLDIPSGTMSAWVRRDHFPADVVIACSLDTGVSLYWLCTGKGSMYEDLSPKQQELPTGLSKIEKYSIQSGKLVELGSWFCDSSLIEHASSKPALIEKGAERWCVDLDFNNVTNGRWLIDIDGNTDVYDVSRLPGNRLSVKNSLSQFECNFTDINCVGMVFLTLSKSI